MRTDHHGDLCDLTTDHRKELNMPAAKDGCVKPAAGPVASAGQSPSESTAVPGGMPQMVARVGQPAPDFEASAFVNGGFDNIKLSDYKGKWVVLCSYPGDFTFV